MTDSNEALGIAWAAQASGIPAVLSFTVETDGRLPDGTDLGSAVTRVDGEATPAWFMVNCAHPTHVTKALDGAGPWVERIRGLRSNASLLSHAELDEAETLDEGDLDLLVASHRLLEQQLPCARGRRRLLRHRRTPRRRTLGRHLRLRGPGASKQESSPAETSRARPARPPKAGGQRRGTKR